MIDPSELQDLAEFLDDSCFVDPCKPTKQRNLAIELVIMKLKQMAEDET